MLTELEEEIKAAWWGFQRRRQYKDTLTENLMEESQKLWAIQGVKGKPSIWEVLLMFRIRTKEKQIVTLLSYKVQTNKTKNVFSCGLKYHALQSHCEYFLSFTPLRPKVEIAVSRLTMYRCHSRGYRMCHNMLGGHTPTKQVVSIPWPVIFVQSVCWCANFQMMLICFPGEFFTQIISYDLPIYYSTEASRLLAMKKKWISISSGSKCFPLCF